MLEELGRHIFVNSVWWVPNSVLVLAVVCNAFVKVYDVPTDVFCPYLNFSPSDEDFFTSAVLTMRDEEPIGIFGMGSGRIAIESIFYDGSSGPRPLTNFLNIGSIPGMPSISASEESGLFFLTAHDSPMYVCRTSDLIAGQPRFVRIDLSLRLSWTFFGCQNGRHFFINPYRGILMAVEFCKDYFGVSILNELEKSWVPSDQTVFSLSAWSVGSDVFALRLSPVA
jgi:hypothetical protein